MSLTGSVLTLILGAVASGYIFEHLRRHVSREVAAGLSALIMLLTLYPLSLRLSAAPGMTFAAWGLCSVAGALATALAYRLFRPGAAGADDPD